MYMNRAEKNTPIAATRAHRGVNRAKMDLERAGQQFRTCTNNRPSRNIPTACRRCAHTGWRRQCCIRRWDGAPQRLAGIDRIEIIKRVGYSGEREHEHKALGEVCCFHRGRLSRLRRISRSAGGVKQAQGPSRAAERGGSRKHRERQAAPDRASRARCGYARLSAPPG